MSNTWSSAPLPGEPGGHLAQTPGRLGERLLLGAEVLDQGVRLGDPGTGRLAVTGLVAPGDDHAGQAPVAGAVGDTGGDLATQRLVVERALTGDHQIRRVQLL